MQCTAAEAADSHTRSCHPYSRHQHNIPAVLMNQHTRLKGPTISAHALLNSDIFLHRYMCGFRSNVDLGTTSAS